MVPLYADAKQMLESHRSALLGRVKQHAGEEHSTGTDREEQSDQSTADEVREVVDRLSGRELRELAEIDAALARIANGTYGQCEGCGQAIGRQRLKALPEARHCMSCTTTANVASGAFVALRSG